MKTDNVKINEVEILQYVQNELAPQQRAAFEQKMAQDATLKQLVHDMQASALPYAAAFASDDMPEMPEQLNDFLDDMSRLTTTTPTSPTTELDSATQTATHKTAPTKRWLPHYGIAASIAAGFFILGSLSQTMLLFPEQLLEQLSEKLPEQKAEQNVAKTTQQPLTAPLNETIHNPLAAYSVPAELIESMIIYQALYTRETVEPVTQSAQEATALLEKFSESHQVKVNIPDLSSQGYAFKRVQTLAYQEQTILQFVYLADSGQPIALCITLGQSKTADNNKPLSYLYANMNTLTWANSEVIYMLMGKLEADALYPLYQAVTAT